MGNLFSISNYYGNKNRFNCLFGQRKRRVFNSEIGNPIITAPSSDFRLETKSEFKRRMKENKMITITPPYL